MLFVPGAGKFGVRMLLVYCVPGWSGPFQGVLTNGAKVDQTALKNLKYMEDLGRKDRLMG